MKVITKCVFQMTDGGLQLLEEHSFEYHGPIERLGGGPTPLQKQQAVDSAALSKESVGLGREENARRTSAFNSVFPDLQKSLAGSPELIARSRGSGLGYLSDRAQNGLPYYQNMVDFGAGNLARSAAPARGDLYRRLGAQNLPSGYRDRAISGFDANLARGFDDNLVGAQQAQDQAKFGAAGQLDSEKMNAFLQNQQFVNQIRGMLMGQQQMSSPIPYFGLAQQGYGQVMNAKLSGPGLGGLLAGVAGGALSAIPK